MSILVEEARALNKKLQVSVMSQIREYERVTGMRITKAAMEYFEDTRYFTTTVFMPPKDMREEKG